MPSTLRIAEVAALLGEPARVQMMLALGDGGALPAGELAFAARITPATASGHLAQLVAGGLLSVAPQGRHRYYRIRSGEVAALLESVLAVAALPEEGKEQQKRRVPSRADAALREARTCYNHLAGRLGVALADALAQAGYVRLSIDGGEVTPAGVAFLSDFGVGFGTAKQETFCRTCIDWSERRLHLSGRVGAALCRSCFERGWIVRPREGRAVEVTEPGRAGFRAIGVAV